MQPFTDAHAAFWFLAEHPQRGYLDSSFIDVLDVVVMKVDPRTHRVEDDSSRNTSSEVWLESGPGMTTPGPDAGSVPWHDPSLDCGAPTFEQALIKLAGLVAAKYGDYRRS